MMKHRLQSKLSHINHSISPIRRYVLYFLVCCGTFIISLAWYFLAKKAHSERFFYETFSLALPWIGIMAGIAFIMVLTVTARFFQLNQQRQMLVHQIRDKYEKEFTERIKAEEDKQKLEIALLHGQKIQAIGTLAGGIAHDFNNILYAIKGYVEMAQEDIPNDTLTHKNLGKVLAATQRGQDLVARILAFGRQRQQHQHKPISLKWLLENILLLLRPTIPSTVEIMLDGTSDDDVIHGDETQLHQVIVNIINNAVDAMDGEGVVTIKITRLTADSDALKQMPDLQKHHYYNIDIRDTGHGMDQATVKRIFEPFFTTKEVGKGSGLGLSTAHTIMKEHEGAISVKSQLGIGTTFTLLLPDHHTE